MGVPCTCCPAGFFGTWIVPCACCPCPSCLWMPHFPFCCLPVCCECQRNPETGAFIKRSRFGAYIGENLLVDSERGTIAYYTHDACCSRTLQQEPSCYCVRALFSRKSLRRPAPS